MHPKIRFCLVLHNHQPIGNFEDVFEQAYQDSYLPFLEVFEPYSALKISLHTSGPLLEWLEQRHPEYLDRLAALVEHGRVEIVGGAFYEPILTMIPSRDRIGQIRSYKAWLENRLGGEVAGMWMPERVWEQSLTADLVAAGMQYTVLDDFHFRNAGWTDEQLDGYYLTEDHGQVLRVFPGSERLRYLIPFAQPHETIEHLRYLAEQRPGALAVFGDDGEKFGTWPETRQHVYDNGWLRQFFDQLTENQQWIDTCTLSSAMQQLPPLGKIYLPDGTYREMTEWALPVERLLEYETLTHELHHDQRWPRLKQFLRGGFWRNFKAKYSEADEMYARMMNVSRRLETVLAQQGNSETLELARQALYRSQCNCSYWHGAFGGIYLPHLRNAVYQQLITADNLLDQLTRPAEPWVEATADDYNFDLRQEVRLANDQLICWLAPSQGGQLYELDLRPIQHNLLATLRRRPEAYHRKVLAGGSQTDQDVASIHDRVVFKQADLDQRLQYDQHPRKSLLDHFYDEHVSLESVRAGHAEELGDFVDAAYESKIRRSPQRVQIQLSRAGTVAAHTVRITKGVTLEAGQHELHIAYLLEDLPADAQLHFAPEMNFAGLPAGADDRYFFHQERVGHLGSQLDLQEVTEIGLADEWLGVHVHLSFDRPTRLWTYPVETVSQSEGGFELVHQSVVVQPHWFVRGDAQGRWAVTMKWKLDTQLAQSRRDGLVASEAH